MRAGAQLDAARKEEAKALNSQLARLQNTTGQPSLTSLTNRASRQKVFEASIARGSRGGEFDNRDILATAIKLRAERAALHCMFSDVRCPRFSGTSVLRDYVEYPSQVNEMWATWPSVLANSAKHYQTGEAIPQELLDKVVAAEQFNQGFDPRPRPRVLPPGGMCQATLRVGYQHEIDAELNAWVALGNASAG